VRYRLKDAAVAGLLATLRRLAERNLAEVRQIVSAYFASRDGLEPVSRHELLARLRQGGARCSMSGPRTSSPLATCRAR
jgi:ArsR family transcriptional regulator